MYILAIGILFITLLVSAYFQYASKKHMREAVKNINGPYCIPLIGPVHLVYQMNPQNIFSKGSVLNDRYGNLFKMWVFNRLIVVCGDAEINEYLLTSSTHISKHHLYDVLHYWLGSGLLFSDGAKWHTRRKIITPTFHFKILEEFVQIFNHQSKILVDRLEAKADGMTVCDIYPYVCSAALDIIAETAMGTKLGAQAGSKLDYTSAVEETTRIMTWRFLRPHLQNDVVFSILHPFKKWRLVQNLRIMHELTKGVIRERREYLKEKILKDNSGIATPDQDDIGSKKRMALLDVLLQSTVNGEPLSDEDIREEVDTFMFEGHDTTATALAYTLYLLSRHPNVQSKLLTEIHQVYGTGELEDCTISSLNELKYLDCVIRESLRKYPPVPIIGRQIKHDLRYNHSKLGEGIIPAGTEMMIAIAFMAGDTEAYENPSEFLPERHEDPNANMGFHYLPFSAGPRNCIGQKFAMLELKVTLCHIVRSYELLPLGEAVQPALGIVLRSKNGMQLGLRKRNIL
ncbi:cytochrome P450 4d8-like [Haematobia irritans]|uniref:cytochrome P450 4d8-like n=1 Tax=Haematobia irritans TaxID=7368 RepID=UPI003F500F69